MEPMEVSTLDIAFPVTVKHLLPAWDDIPEEFRQGDTPWNQLASEWFFKGLSVDRLKAKPGVDQQKALRHLQAVLGSFEPKHEHKEAGAAYLLSQWFEAPR